MNYWITGRDLMKGLVGAAAESFEGSGWGIC